MIDYKVLCKQTINPLSLKYASLSTLERLPVYGMNEKAAMNQRSFFTLSQAAVSCFSNPNWRIMVRASCAGEPK